MTMPRWLGPFCCTSGISLHQFRVDGVLEVVGPFSVTLKGLGCQLGVDVFCLLVLFLRHAQSRAFTPASEDLEVPKG